MNSIVKPVLVISAVAVFGGCAADSSHDHSVLDQAYSMSELDAYVGARLAEAPDPDRIESLTSLAEAIAATENPQVTFICTHNSRRSHMAQIWAQVGAEHFGLKNVETFSGGTEATAFNPRAVAALQRAGLKITKTGDDNNPQYKVDSGSGEPMDCFSKRFGDFPNPQSDFIAVMTCSSADEACPIVPGAAARVSVPYIDPKLSDGTDSEAATYDERCADIAREMLWVMKRVAE